MSQTIKICSAIVLGIALVGLVIAAWSPHDVLAENSLAERYVSLISAVLPLDRYASHSAFPQVAKLYYSIVWLAFPFALIATWAVCRERDGKGDGLLFRPKDKLGFFPRVALLVLSPLWLFLAYVGLFYWGGDTRLFAFGSSFLQLSMLGILGPILTAIALALGIGSLVKAIRGHF